MKAAVTFAGCTGQSGCGAPTATGRIPAAVSGLRARAVCSRGSVRWPCSVAEDIIGVAGGQALADLVAHSAARTRRPVGSPQPLLKRVQPFPCRLAEGRNIDRDALGGFP